MGRLVFLGLMIGRISGAEKEELDHRKLVESCAVSFHEKAVAQVSKSLESSLKDVMEVVPLEDAQKDKFRAAIAQIAEDRATDASQIMARYFEPMGDERLAAYLRAAQGRPLPQDTPRVEGARLLATLDHPKEWETALQDILSVEQKQHWDGEVKTRHDRARDQEIEEFIRPRRWRVVGQVTQRLNAALIEARGVLGLTDQRYKALKDLRDQVAGKVADAWALKESNWLKALPEESRSSYVVTQGSGDDAYVGYDTDATDAAWKEAFATQISADEATRYEESLSQRPKKRASCFARLFIADKDIDVYLTTRQRERLEPAVTAAFQASSWVTSLAADGPLVDLARLYSEGHKTRSEVVSDVLDEAQMERWDRRLLAGIEYQRLISNGDSLFHWKEQAVQWSIPQVLSEFLREQYTLRGPLLKKAMHLKILDLGHVLGLDERELRPVEMAGMGAVERSLETYTENCRASAEVDLQGAQPDEIVPRLMNLLKVAALPPAPEKEAVWRRALEEHLAPEQLTLWNKEVEERTQYDDRAVVDLILLDLSSKYGLSEAQEQQLAPRILGAMQAMNETRPWRRHWYLSTVERLLPVSGIQEPDLKGILTQDQWREFDSRDGYVMRQYLKNLQRRTIVIPGN